MIQYGFTSIDGKEYEFSGQLTLSIGDGLSLDTRYGYDASKRPQSVVRRKRNTARTGTVQIQCSRVNTPDLPGEVQKYEEMAGAVGELWWEGKNHGLWCLRDVSISMAVDAVDIVTGLQVSINIAEAYKAKKESRIKNVKVNLF